VETAPNWIELDGAVNARDLGGVPLIGGGAVIAHRLIRTDNLQDLSPRDVRLLVDVYDVRAVADLRTTIEVTSEGPGPLTHEPGIEFSHRSLFEEDNIAPDIIATDDGPVVLPWQNPKPGDRRTAVQVYLGYLTKRPESVIGALRLIAHSPGATVVHCAAGKDRTGVVIALALDAVGAQRAAIIADFARTGDRLPQLLARLAASATYTHVISVDDPDRHAPRASTMEQFLGELDAQYGGTASWLAASGWTADDAQALQAKLTES
jgi:protein-tyrosine phosphatase